MQEDPIVVLYGAAGIFAAIGVAEKSPCSFIGEKARLGMKLDHRKRAL